MQRPYLGQVGIMPQYQQPILPPATSQQKKPAKALVGFGQVPKFVPPAYDNVLPDDLPCPETPSPRGSLASERGEESWREARPTRDDTRPLENPAKETRAATRRPMPEGKPFPPGTFVEYRSRTMQDRWILAKVEAFDDKNRVYKLDVQPKAPWDRVRLRQPGSQSAAPPVPRPTQADPEPADRPQRREVPQTASAYQPGVESVQRDTAAMPPATAPVPSDLHLLSAEQLQKRVMELAGENASLRRQLEAERGENANLRRQLEG